MLKIKSLKKQFGEDIIWNNLTANFSQGEIVCIQGKSGEGKTTFLRCLNNLEKVDGGTIIIDDFYLCSEENGLVRYANVDKLKDLSTKIGMIFQNFNLFPNLNVEENLFLAPRYKEIDEITMKNRAESLLKDMNLYDKKKLYPYQLSGGQQQRVAIARACMLNPKVLCFDEPTSALDDANKEQVIEIIKKLAQNGMTQIIVTHDSEFARCVADRTLNIIDGTFQNL